MKRLNGFVIGIILSLSGCVKPPTDTVFQTSTIDALLAGVYEGDQTCRSLLKNGDLGIGTFNGLDGEMAVLEGKLYQIKADGKAYQPDLSVQTPFAVVCRFSPEMEFALETGADFTRVEELISDQAKNQNLICAIKISGEFRSMRIRTVPRQNKPYPPLLEVTAHQPEFQMENIAGTIVGFRFPAFIKGINMPGYHLHFISKDHTRGGHLLSFGLISGTCQVDVLHRFMLSLPEGDKAFAETDLTKDRSMELKKVEGGGK